MIALSPSCCTDETALIIVVTDGTTIGSGIACECDSWHPSVEDVAEEFAEKLPDVDEFKPLPFGPPPEDPRGVRKQSYPPTPRQRGPPNKNARDAGTHRGQGPKCLHWFWARGGIELPRNCSIPRNFRTITV